MRGGDLSDLRASALSASRGTAARGAPTGGGRRAPAARRGAAVARATLAASAGNHVALAAGGCAFFTTLALFPAMSLLIALYGLVFDPAGIEPHLRYLQTLLPPEAFGLISRWMHHLVVQSSGRLGLGVGISGLITLWSAAIGTRALLATLSSTYGAGRTHGFWLLNLLALALTAAALLAVILGVAALTLLPAAVNLLDPAIYRPRMVHLAGNAALIVCAGAFIALLYAASSRTGARPGRRIAPGAVLATGLWLAASALLSAYVDDVARFSMTYGPLGAVIGLMLWLYLTFYAVLIGAELNAQLERGVA